MKILDTLFTSVVGMVVVFFVLILLMAIIYIITKLVKRLTDRQGAKEPAPAAAAADADAPAPVSAPATVKLEVPDKTAAMIMAIVAEELGGEPETLRFISIREAK